MIRSRGAAYAAVLMLVVFELGCGDSFRPTAIPIVQPGGDPDVVKHAVVLSDPGGGARGSVTNENLSGDTIVLERQTGVAPVHAGLIAAATKLYVANRGDDTVSSYSTFANILNRTVTLPAGSAPVFVHTMDNSFMFVANSGTNPGVCAGGGAVGVISVTQDALVNSVCVNGPPAALASSVDGRRLYAASPSTDSVTAIGTQDATVTAVIPVGDAPVWTVADRDNRFIYVANSGSGTVSVIAEATNAVVATIAVGANPTHMVYDANRRRVYVVNTGGNSVSIIDAGLPTPALLATVAVGATPRSVTVLADGTRAYVANAGSNTVSVINANSNSVVNTIPVGTAPVSIASGLNSAKVVVANSGSASMSVIRTSDDTVIATLPVDPNPVWVLATP